MNHAEKCPICNGNGTVERDTGTAAGRVNEICHGCGGKGWITVESFNNYPIRQDPPSRLLREWFYPYSGTING